MHRRDFEGAAGGTSGRTLAAGAGWSVADVVCTSRPEDRPFEEQHAAVSIAIVAAGTFLYRGTRGAALMTPGSLLVGGDGERFCCSHEHAAGDRCIAFRYDRGFFESIVADADTGPFRAFRQPRVPPVRTVSGVVARGCALLAGGAAHAWDELALDVAVAALAADSSTRRTRPPAPRSIARVAETIRSIQLDSAAPRPLADLAAAAGLSPFHYLRTFRELTGVTPHQFVRRTRLIEAGARLLAGGDAITAIAFDSGFGDLSNFNHAFRHEFGDVPRAFRRRYA